MYNDLYAYHTPHMYRYLQFVFAILLSLIIYCMYMYAPMLQPDLSSKSMKVEEHPVRINLPFNVTTHERYRHILVRAAYFDKRRYGRHQNATVLLAHVKKSIVNSNLVISCSINGHSAIEFDIKSLDLNNWIHTYHRECTYDDVLIYCYDIQARNNSRVLLVYENPNNRSEHFTTESEYPLFIPSHGKEERTASVMTCTTVFDTPPHFGAWIRYQKTLGVSLVYINAHDSFTQSKEFNDSFFQKSLKNGFVHLQVWKEYLKPGALFYHSQGLYYQNCIFRFLGQYVYSIMSDTDDFLILRDGRPLDIGHTLHSIFNLEKNTGSIRLKWVRYVQPMNFTEEAIFDGNLTRHVDISLAAEEDDVKSIYKLSVTKEANIHFVAKMLPGYKSILIPRTVAYMAHIKRYGIERTTCTFIGLLLAGYYGILFLGLLCTLCLFYFSLK